MELTHWPSTGRAHTVLPQVAGSAFLRARGPAGRLQAACALTDALLPRHAVPGPGEAVSWVRRWVWGKDGPCAGSSAGRLFHPVHPSLLLRSRRSGGSRPPWPLSSGAERSMRRNSILLCEAVGWGRTPQPAAVCALSQPGVLGEETCALTGPAAAAGTGRLLPRIFQASEPCDWVLGRWSEVW